MNDEVKKWILSQQNICDKIIANACKEFWNSNKHRSNFHYDLKKCHEESYELVKGRDLCYDRLNTALTYTLWYHPRRINTFLSFFIDKLIDLSGQRIELFDLGAGTGAVQWAILLTAYGLKEKGLQPPKIRIINIDTSPFMLHFNRDYLWQHFLKQYPFSSEEVQIEYNVNSWNNENDLESSNTFIASSYLFDSSDNKEKIKEDFIEIIKQYSPSKLLLLTSRNKSPYLNSLLPEFIELGYAVEKNANNKLLFNQSLSSINALRRELNTEYTDISPLSNKSTWQDPSHFGVILSRKQNEISLSTNTKINNIDLFTPPITIRKEIKLNEKQKKAAKYSDTPSVVIGPAGCGKSIVITEKILNTVKHYNYDPNLKILVTTFNKSLISQLSNWLSDMLDSTKFTRTGVKFFFRDSKLPNISLLHFDILPLRLGDVPSWGLVNEQSHINLMNEIINLFKTEELTLIEKNLNIFNPDFLLEEYHRVIYGLEIGINGKRNVYLDIKRIGRGRKPRLEKNGPKRQLVFSILERYAITIFKKKIPSFTLRRQYFKSKLESGQITVKYNYIFVDEFQDCTKSDFRIFNLLLTNPNHLTIAGDLAQAVQLGKTAKIPRFENMGKRDPFHRLEGSYRLPVRVSEAIKPISEAIKISTNNNEGAGIITPYKGSPPGSRPIVVYAPTLELIANKISDIIRVYSIYDIRQATILEKDHQLSKELNELGIRTETDTILRLKGLEKRCIIWSTRAAIEYEKEVFEFVYTILTRTSAILIIALLDNSLPIFKPVIARFNSNRLILWDEETEDKFAVFCELMAIEPNADE